MRDRRSISLLLSFIWLASPTLLAQQPGTANVQGALLAQRSLAALTGRGAPIKDVTLTGSARRTVGSADETGTAVFRALATGEARADFSFPSGQRSESYTNSSSGPLGAWEAPDGTSGAMPLHNLLVDSAWFCPALMLSKQSSSQNLVVSDGGRETHDGLMVERLAISKQFPSLPARVSAAMQRLSEMEVYLDAITSLPVSVSFNTHPDNNAGRDFPVEIKFSDYRIVNGVQIPFHLQKYINGGLVLDLQFEKADLNTGLSSTAFTVPEAAPVPVLQNSPQKGSSITTN
jgi:hypothetical protein